VKSNAKAPEISGDILRLVINIVEALQDITENIPAGDPSNPST